MNKTKGGKVFTWTQLLGFDKNETDKGVKNFLENTGFVPDGVYALVHHADFVHQYRGMDEEYILPPDNCAYFGIPFNAERQRQEWTNHDVRALATELKKAGSGLYFTLFAHTLDNRFHNEWVEDHPEVKAHARGGVRMYHCLLKHFKDGTLYEDFFIDKACEVLRDYNMRGIHIADWFWTVRMAYADFSCDLVEQFTKYTGISLPDCVNAQSDEAEIEDARADYIWANLRKEWILFINRRWADFYKKLCDRVHAIGCEVSVLGMYCTDPFETRYCLGIDLNMLSEAGVDWITENILPSSCFATSDDTPLYFHRYMAIAPLTAAHVKKSGLVSMLGLQDATEEWDMMHHLPCLHERDLYTMMAYQLQTGNSAKRALEGYLLCLCDGIRKEDWVKEHRLLEIGMSGKVKKSLSPVMLWSDTAYENMLDEYIEHKRITPFKLFYELGKSGAMLGGAIRSEDLDGFDGSLIVPDFDMLSEEERNLVASYKGKMIITAKKECDITKWGIEPALVMEDKFSDYPLCAYAVNTDISDELKEGIASLLSCDDGSENLKGDITKIPELTCTVLHDTLIYAKVTQGFFDAVALATLSISKDVVECDVPYLAYELQDGNIRLYIFNTNELRYKRAYTDVYVPVADTKIVSDFPVLSVRYSPGAKNQFIYFYDHTEKRSKQNFEIKLQPGGVSIVDIITEK